MTNAVAKLNIIGNLTEYKITEEDQIKIAEHFSELAAILPSLNEKYDALIKIEEITPEIEGFAKELSKRFGKVRTKSKEIHDDVKKYALNFGRAVDAADKYIYNDVKPKEIVLDAIANTSVNIARQEKAALQEDRLLILKGMDPSGEFYNANQDYADMDKEVFYTFVDGVGGKVAKAKADAVLLADAQVLIDKQNVENAIKERLAFEEQRKENERLRLINELHSKRSKEMRPLAICIRNWDIMIELPENEYQKELADNQRAMKEHLAFEESKRIEAANAIAEANALKQKEFDRLIEESIPKENRMLGTKDKPKFEFLLKQIKELEYPDGNLSTKGYEVCNKIKDVINRVVVYIEKELPSL